MRSGRFVCHSVYVQNYCKSDEPISLKLGVYPHFGRYFFVKQCSNSALLHNVKSRNFFLG